MSRVSGYERYARIPACRPSRSPRWRVAVGERHACFVESRGRQATLQLGPDGVPQTAQVMWQPRTAAEALFERDSVRRAFLDDGGEYCRSQDGGGHLSEVWTVGAVRAVITVDTAPPFGPRVVVAAIDSLLAGCVDGPPR